MKIKVRMMRSKKQKMAIKKSKGLEAKLKCDKCEYETNKRITLVKHKNTKHGQTEKNQEI